MSDVDNNNLSWTLQGRTPLNLQAQFSTCFPKLKKYFQNTPSRMLWSKPAHYQASSNPNKITPYTNLFLLILHFF